MAITKAKKLARLQERRRADAVRCGECKYCDRDHGRFGPGWVEIDNNGPIVGCPVCNPSGTYLRQR